MKTKALYWWNYLLGWRFLPRRLQDWLFGTGTRAVELISGLGLLGFALAFANHAALLTRYPIYHKFATAPPALTVSVLAAVGLAQLLLMVWHSPRANILSGFVLLVGGVLWFLIFAAFSANYPPFNPSMALPFILAAVCSLAGKNLIDYSRLQIRTQERYGKDGSP
ncbi:hypothetical protein [Conchiformibius kuhniae]|uniref:Uncharacterized protein n=1 Tax=Conchiformibius kuhniae TaxID=211502 RepID=A0A8T9MUN2_9NEIS|nr:hypothetical protein [Conchiformibius kuhniae]UOP05357.1 hypothetical protein LVJ77_03945 [Conchiformibius kuhniae]